MATSRKSDVNKPNAKAKKNVAGASAARNSDSASSKAPPVGTGDLLAEQAAEVEATVAAMPFNENKAAEHGREGATEPPEGMQVIPPSPLVTGSTLAEVNASEKSGTRAPEGVNTTVGSLDRVRRVVKTFGMVNCAPGFNRTPQVIDGCSNLLVQVFGDAGRGARSAVGMAELPFDISVEIELVLEVGD
jgi:hypothetical protein